jgi:anti-sigma factor RsiW
MAHDRDVAGIRCSEVLQRLSEYFDGELSPEQARAIEAHTAGCDWCARFGGDFSHAVERLRSNAQPPSIDPALAERLRLALESA